MAPASNFQNKSPQHLQNKVLIFLKEPCAILSLFQEKQMLLCHPGIKPKLSCSPSEDLQITHRKPRANSNRIKFLAQCGPVLLLTESEVLVVCPSREAPLGDWRPEGWRGHFSPGATIPMTLEKPGRGTRLVLNLEPVSFREST